MHEELFKKPSVAARYRTGPYAEARERYLRQAHSDGYSRSTLERMAWALLIVAEAVRDHGGHISLSQLEDIAILTGGTMVSSDLGVKLENVTIQMLGKTKKVMIEKENTTIISGAGKKADIEARISQLPAISVAISRSGTAPRFA